MIKQIPPIIVKPSYYDLVEKTLNNFWEFLFYNPIKIIGKKNIAMILNDANFSILRDALMRGKVQFNDGVFSGLFNSRMVKELKKMGARFIKRTGNYAIDPKTIPMSIQSTIAISKTKFENLNKDILDYLDGIDEDTIEEAINKLNLEQDYTKVISDLDKEYLGSIKNIAINPNITPEIATNLRNNYTENMELYIKNWTEENIIKLREKVYENSLDGFRAENLIKIIQKNKGVSERKAKFLAKQETSLLTAQYRAERYTSVGVTKYKWRIRGVRTRPDHKALNDKIFRFDDPPITNKKTDARNNPGEDFNCFCTAIALAEF